MNINDQVEVMLTDKGLTGYQDFYRDVKKRCNNEPLWDDEISRTNRTLCTSLWHLMEVFGPLMHMGAENSFVCNEMKIIEP